MKFCSLASGSRGNSLFFSSEKIKILIDAGISTKLIESRLNEIGESLSEIDAILITHEHADHIQGLKTLSKKFSIPIVTNKETAKGIFRSLHISPKFKIFSTDEAFVLGDLVIKPFSIQHDTMDPVALSIQSPKGKIGICTDLGCVTTSVRKNLEDCDILFVEANHQPSMVAACSRPNLYKKRVLGRQGHLSNEAVADLIQSVLNEKLKAIFLAHLSQECNNPELALKIVRDILEKNQKEIPVSIAYQEKRSQLIEY